LDTRIDSSLWAQASIAAAIMPKYGQHEMQDFADAVGKSVDYVRKMARTFRYFAEKNTQVLDLTFKHHTIAIRHHDPEGALTRAQEGWSCQRLEEWIINEAVEQKPKRKSAKRIQKDSDLAVFLEHVEEVIETDFIAKCPDRDFSRRIFQGWLDDIRWENRQITFSENRDRVLRAIETQGAATVKMIVQVTGLSIGEVNGVVGKLVGDGDYEWTSRGGETDVARGTKEKILHKVGTGLGSNYSAPSKTSQYDSGLR
jgi:hypothetical protein